MNLRDDGITDSYATSPFDDDTRMGGRSKESHKPNKKQHRLDSPKMLRVLNQLREWFSQEWERQAHNRFQMAMDEDYYDSMQWTEEDAAEVLARGQAPIVYNEIKPTIDWMIGTERRTRIDYKVLPRRKEGNDDAEVKTKLMKYLSDVNKQPYARSRAFAMACKSGMGWIEVGVRGDKTDEPIFYRAQNWRHMLPDSNAIEPDYSDGRYKFRWKYLDPDIAMAYFPDRANIIRDSIIDGDKLGMGENDDELWYMGARVTEAGQDFAAASTGKYRPYDGSAFANSRRSRVKMMECWYTVPVTMKMIRGGQFDGKRFNEKRDSHKAEVEIGNASLYDKVVMQMRVAIFTDKGLLWESESPYEHNRDPFVPVVAYRRARDNAPYAPIRPMRDSQDSLNKRGSKALWILSSNQVVADKGAVDDIDEAREEIARPDGWIEKNKGFDVEIRRDIALAEEHLRLMDRDMMYIRNGGGVTNENLGRETNADSGKAIIARQEQGGVVTTEIFDNLRYAVQIAGEMELSLIEQYYTDEKVVRIVGDRGTASFVEVNKKDPETGEVLNDITAMKADFMVSEQDYRDSLRQAMYESLFDVVSRLAQMQPQLALNLLDLVVEMADIPNRDELVNRIRQISGMRDPEAEPTPEEIAQAQREKQIADTQQKIALEMALTELQKAIAEKEKYSAEAINKKIEAFYSAAQAAGIVVQNSGIMPVADEILASAGFQDATPDEGIPNQQAPVENSPVQNLPEPQSPFVGVREGIETPELD